MRRGAWKELIKEKGAFVGGQISASHTNGQFQGEIKDITLSKDERSISVTCRWVAYRINGPHSPYAVDKDGGAGDLMFKDVTPPQKVGDTFAFEEFGMGQILLQPPGHQGNLKMDEVQGLEDFLKRAAKAA